MILWCISLTIDPNTSQTNMTRRGRPKSVKNKKEKKLKFHQRPTRTTTGKCNVPKAERKAISIENKRSNEYLKRQIQQEANKLMQYHHKQRKEQLSKDVK